MKKIVLSLCLISVALASKGAADNSNPPQLFTTSRCFDLIASLQYFDKIKEEPQFRALSADSVFMFNLNHINENVTASKLCNFYALFNENHDNTDDCVSFFAELNENPETASSADGWIKAITALQPELSKCLSAINDAGYNEYWETNIKPKLDEYINSYPVKSDILDAIHSAITDFSGSEALSERHSKIYVINIDNAFNLSDESFCCTPILLDPEIEKLYRIDFLKVYIHENLHRLAISQELMSRLEELMDNDAFYRENESIARGYNEGMNEAFVVASEVFISKNIGRRDNKSIYNEFKEYIDGALVLAPVIYTQFEHKRKEESLNDFSLRLFDTGIIKSGSVKAEYDKAMQQLELQALAE